jgi:fructose/tagatose bisphosphate aldolase
MRVMFLEFLDTDVFHVSLENCVSFLDPLIDSWDIDVSTFSMNIALNRRFAPGHSKRLEFVEAESGRPLGDEPGLSAFLKDASLNADVTPEEFEFLKRLRFKGKRPTPLYYYRELQNLRDPLHFHAVGSS